MQEVLKFLSELGARLLEGLKVSAIGIGITFILMLLLIAFILLIKYALDFTGTEKKRTLSPNVRPEKERNTPPQPQGVSPQTVAAITAAISCILEEESRESGKPKAGFIVRKIRKVNNF